MNTCTTIIIYDNYFVKHITKSEYKKVHAVFEKLDKKVFVTKNMEVMKLANCKKKNEIMKIDQGRHFWLEQQICIFVPENIRGTYERDTLCTTFYICRQFSILIHK